METSGLLCDQHYTRSRVKNVPTSNQAAAEANKSKATEIDDKDEMVEEIEEYQQEINGYFYILILIEFKTNASIGCWVSWTVTTQT